MRRRALLSAGLATACPKAWCSGRPVLAYITNQGSHNVSVIDVDARRVITTIPVGPSPAGIAVLRTRQEAWVCNAGANSLSVIDTRQQRVVEELAAGTGGAIGVAASADERRIYVVDWYGQALLSFDVATRRQLGPRVSLGAAPAGVVADGRLAWVAERDDDRVALIDPDAGMVIARISVGHHPFGLLLDAKRRRLYALNVLGDNVSVIDTERRALVRNLPCGKAPYAAALSASGERLYVTNQHDGSVSVWDADTLDPLPLLRGFGYPEGIAAVGDTVLVVNWMDDEVSLIDGATNRERARIAVGKNPRAFGSFLLT